MVGYLKVFVKGKSIFWAQNNFSSAPTLCINNDRSLTVKLCLSLFSSSFWVGLFGPKVFCCLLQKHMLRYGWSLKFCIPKTFRNFSNQLFDSSNIFPVYQKIKQLNFRSCWVVWILILLHVVLIYVHQLLLLKKS